MLAERFASGHLAVKDGLGPPEIAQSLADGARGVDQAFPVPDPDEILLRHRRMARAVLYGCVVQAPAA